MERSDAQLRQRQLLTRSAELRVQLAQQAQVFRGPLALVDQARTIFHRLVANPVWPLLAALALLAWKPVRALSWASRLWWAWRGYQELRLWFTRQR